jgi:hypothetical protein
MPAILLQFCDIRPMYSVRLLKSSLLAGVGHEKRPGRLLNPIYFKGCSDPHLRRMLERLWCVRIE